MADFIRRTLIELLPRLRRFGLALTGSSVDADDLVQTACERVLSRAGQLRDHARMDAWMYGIMRNLWIDELRHRRVRRHDPLEAADDVVGEDGEALADDRMTLAAVRGALLGLPEEQRSVLMLVCVDGLSYRETAETLGIPIGTVMSRLARARLDLHERVLHGRVLHGRVLHGRVLHGRVLHGRVLHGRAADHADGDPVVSLAAHARRKAASQGGGPA